MSAVVEVGYWLSSEEHAPRELVENAKRAENAGFSYALRLGTAVTCPLIRLHPVVVAQAAATSALLMQGRFFLGVGTGELLNEHIVGVRWPRPDERLEMLEEALELIRKLWQGEYETFRGRHYTVEQARLFDVPDQPPELIVAAAAENAAQLAAKWGDGLISTSPDGDVIDAYRQAGGTDPIHGKVTGDDPAAWREGIEMFGRLGFTHLCLHDVSENQRGFIDFARQFLER